MYLLGERTTQCGTSGGTVAGATGRIWAVLFVQPLLSHRGRPIGLIVSFADRLRVSGTNGGTAKIGVDGKISAERSLTRRVPCRGAPDELIASSEELTIICGICGLASHRCGQFGAGLVHAHYIGRRRRICEWAEAFGRRRVQTTSPSGRCADVLRCRSDRKYP